MFRYDRTESLTRTGFGKYIYKSVTECIITWWILMQPHIPSMLQDSTICDCGITCFIDMYSMNDLIKRIWWKNIIFNFPWKKDVNFSLKAESLWAQIRFFVKLLLIIFPEIWNGYWILIWMMYRVCEKSFSEVWSTEWRNCDEMMSENPEDFFA